MTAITGEARGLDEGLDSPTSGWERRYVAGAFVGDVACSVTAFACLVSVRMLIERTDWSEPVLGLILVSLWPAAIALAGGYHQRYLGDGWEEYRKIIQAAIGLASAVAILAYSTQTPVARSFVMAGIPLAAFLDLLFRHRLRRKLTARRKKGECLRRVVAVGHAAAVDELVRQLRRAPHHGMEVVAACLPRITGVPLPREVAGVPVLGDFVDVSAVVIKTRADTVAVLSCPELDGVALRRLAWKLEETDTELYVASALMEVAGPRISIRPVAGLPLLHVEHPDLDGMRQIIKSAFDKALAIVAIVLASPLMLAIVALIRMTSAGPAIFAQTRVGKHGREFTVLKFRTMVLNADAIKTDLVARSEGNGVLFKIRNDPRITRIGGWLRRYSVDELPQLFNVVRGDMSLVGPRPPLPEEVEQYGTDVRRRLVVKPGMTGLWQVSGRSDLSWEESVRLDLRYVENWSLALDLQILWKTGSAVLRGAGAY
ncbi:sugar transferase [Nonomuraea sp. NPDC059194]|uniref:sugar transferase n=1 Tax=Nonomuraea sp. NPDC059194 TaxID=3346764 RepID=UPI0036C67F50